MSGKKFAEGFCIRNRHLPQTDENYGACKYPMPPLNPTNVAVWNLYLRTYGAINAIGMEGVQVGRHPADVEAVAHAMGVPWDEITLDKFSIIEGMHIEDLNRRAEAARKKK